MADQQQEQAINLGNNLNIGVLMGSLMDLQQLVRAVPNIIAAAEQFKTQLAEKDAKIADLEARLAALAPKAVEAAEAKAE
jgi:hypothetical protein